VRKKEQAVYEMDVWERGEWEELEREKRMEKNR